MYKRTIRWLRQNIYLPKVNICNLLISFVIVFLLSCLFYFGPQADTSGFLSAQTQVYRSILADVLIWDTEYSKDMEDCIIDELCLLPASLIDRWLDAEGLIHITSTQEGYLEKLMKTVDVNSSPTKVGHVAGFNRMTLSKDGTVLRSEIYIMGDSEIIKDTLLHEMGHFFFVDQFTYEHVTLPHYFEDREKFCVCIFNDYYMAQLEYEAELFAFTVHNGKTSFFKDSILIYDWLAELDKENQNYLHFFIPN